MTGPSSRTYGLTTPKEKFVSDRQDDTPSTLLLDVGAAATLAHRPSGRRLPDGRAPVRGGGETTHLEARCSYLPGRAGSRIGLGPAPILALEDPLLGAVNVLESCGCGEPVSPCGVCRELSWPYVMPVPVPVPDGDAHAPSAKASAAPEPGSRVPRTVGLIMRNSFRENVGEKPSANMKIEGAVTQTGHLVSAARTRDPCHLLDQLESVAHGPASSTASSESASRRWHRHGSQHGTAPCRPSSTPSASRVEPLEKPWSWPACRDWRWARV